MMILAIDTATPMGGVALLDGERLLGREDLLVERAHAATLAAACHRLLSAHQLSPRELALLAVTTGPGSFTGVRIGLAFAKGLALALETPVVGVSTLMAMSPEEEEGPWLALLPAGRGELHAACFQPGDPPVPLLSDGLFSPADLAGWWRRQSPAPRLLGPGVALFLEAAGPVLPSEIIAWSRTGPDPVAVGRLGRRLLALHGRAAVADLEPLYLRKSEAERLRDARQPALRPMTRKDLETLALLDRQLSPHPWGVGQFAEELGATAWVLEAAGEVAGFAIVRPLLDEWHLLNLGVAPALQGRGLGRMLLERAIGAAREGQGKRMLLEVRLSREKARNLYTKAGFQEIGRRKGYYPGPDGGETAVVMALQLDGEVAGDG